MGVAILKTTLPSLGMKSAVTYLLFAINRKSNIYLAAFVKYYSISPVRRVTNNLLK